MHKQCHKIVLTYFVQVYTSKYGDLNSLTKKEMSQVKGKICYQYHMSIGGKVLRFTETDQHFVYTRG